MAGTHFGGRTLARSQALQLLFQAEATGRLVSEVLEGAYALDQGELDDYARSLALGTDSMLHELDAVIGATSSNWSISRIPAVDRNLLRMALYEMLYVDEVDTAVAIDECVDLERAYGSADDSFRFANGLLGRVARQMEAGEDVVARALEAMAASSQSEADAAETVDTVEQLDEGLAELTEDAATDEAAEPAAGEPSADADDLPAWVKE